MNLRLFFVLQKDCCRGRYGACCNESWGALRENARSNVCKKKKAWVMWRIWMTLVEKFWQRGRGRMSGIGKCPLKGG